MISDKLIGDLDLIIPFFLQCLPNHNLRVCRYSVEQFGDNLGVENAELFCIHQALGFGHFLGVRLTFVDHEERRHVVHGQRGVCVDLGQRHKIPWEVFLEEWHTSDLGNGGSLDRVDAEHTLEQVSRIGRHMRGYVICSTYKESDMVYTEGAFHSHSQALTLNLLEQ